MSGLMQRISTAIVFVIIVLVGIFGGLKAFLALSFLIAVFCGVELLGILHPRDQAFSLRRFLGIVMSISPIIYIVLTQNDIITLSPGESIAFLTLTCFILFVIELFVHSDEPFTSIGASILILIYVGLPLSLLAHMAYNLEVYDPLFILSLFLFTWVTDSGAFFIGSWFGKHKLFERISPKKTIEGFIGGFVVAIIVGYLYSYISESLTPFHWMTLAGTIAITASIGDLIESMLKRSHNIKDSGAWLPGHGGFLDRFDGFLFSLPFAYAVIHLLP
ncbi:MAG: phosphatidate cytidylyltransferase [Bacteroidia bacterium]|nr:phosphatidate cytidylyltransferase [Bacteroidia bacterium]